MYTTLYGKYDVLYRGDKTGTLTVKPDGLMTVFDCVSQRVWDDVLRLAVITGPERIVLGVMMPRADTLHFNKRYSKNDLNTMGLYNINYVQLIDENERQTPYIPPLDALEDIEANTEENETRINLRETVVRENNSPNANSVEPEGTEQQDLPYIIKGDPNRNVSVKPDGPPSTDIPVDPVVIDVLEAPQNPDVELNPQGSNERIIVSPDYPDPIYPDSSSPDVNDNGIWQEVENPSVLFTDEELRKLSVPVSGILKKDLGPGEASVAVPLAADEPFPLMPIFCFGKSEKINGNTYLTFGLKDGQIATE